MEKNKLPDYKNAPPPPPTREEKLYNDAFRLFENINDVLKNHKDIDTLNSKMTGLLRDLNGVRIEKITGKTDFVSVEDLITDKINSTGP
jgi:hypothetical protein